MFFARNIFILCIILIASFCFVLAENLSGEDYEGNDSSNFSETEYSLASKVVLETTYR